MNIKRIVAVLTCICILSKSYTQPTQSYCQKFSGNQLLQLRNTAQLNLGASFTMEAWVFLEAASPYAVIMGKTFDPRANDPYQHFVISLDATGLKPEFVQTTGTTGSYKAASSTTAIPFNTWTHLAATLGNGQMKLYVNGVLAATQTSPGTPASATTPFALGSGATPSYQVTCCGLKGALMQARVWSVEQTQATIQTNKQTELSGNESGLVACWPLNDSTGQTLRDITSNGYHLTRGTAVTTDAEDAIAWKINQLGPFFSYTTITLPSDPNNTEDMYLMDYNSDGKKDLLISHLKWPPTVPATNTKLLTLKNNGGMNFTNENAIIGFDSLVHPRDYAVADYNGDGKADLFIADHGTDVNPFPGGQNRIYYQNNNGQLVESSNINIPTQLDFSHNTTAADIDKDGDVDIYVCNIYGKDNIGPRLLINNGSGRFTVNTSNIPANIANLTDRYMSSRFVDIDNDGDPDLVLGAADNGGIAKDALLLNNGAGVFTTAVNALPNRYGNSQWGTVAVTASDINKDGYSDLLMSTLYQYQTCQLQLLINNKNGTFSDSTQNIPQSWATSNTWIKWIETADFNNDGWTDFVVSTHGGTPKLFYNTGATKFIDASAILSIPNGVASIRPADYDGDGMIDIAFLDFSSHVILAKNIKPFPVELNPAILTAVAERTNADKRLLLEIFPNPVKQKLTIKVKATVKNYTLQIVNMQGQLLQQIPVTNNEVITVNAGTLPNGIYFVKLMQANKVIETRKIIINN